MSNAIKFTRSGVIQIIIEKISNYEIRAQVKDSGIGIKTEDEPKIFKLFSSIKNQENGINVEGIGLGLVISKLIVEKFDGQINFKSTY